MLYYNNYRDRDTLMIRSLFLLTFFCLLPVAAASAQSEIRRAAAHEHSVAAAQLAVEAGRIDLMLQAPGANLVGFEHPPRDEEQRARLDAARQRLAAGAWLVLPDAADCQSEFEIETPGFGADGSTPEAGHEHSDDHAHTHADDQAHDHEHDHDNNHDHGSDHNHDHEDAHQHAEFRVTGTIECARPDALEWVEIRLFSDWPDNRSLRVDAVSPTAQWRVELNADQPRIVLQ